MGETDLVADLEADVGIKVQSDVSTLVVADIVAEGAEQAWRRCRSRGMTELKCSPPEYSCM